MDRIERARQAITKAFLAGTPIPTIAAKHMAAFRTVQNALDRWGVLAPCAQVAEPIPLGAAPCWRSLLSIPRPIPAKEPEPMRASPKVMPADHPAWKRAQPEVYAERNAQITTMKRENPRMTASEIATRLNLSSRQVVIGVLNRAGFGGSRETQPLQQRIAKKRKPREAAPRTLEETPRTEGRRPPVAEWGGFLSIPNEADKPKHAPTLRMTLEPMGSHVGELLDDTTGCVWPFDDRSPWPRREHRAADYLRCNLPRESFRTPRGEIVTRPYCECHWDRAHGDGKPKLRRRR